MRAVVFRSIPKLTLGECLVETRANVQDAYAAIQEDPMDTLATQRRVERVIRECRSLGIEPEARTVAEIMVDDDVTRDKYDSFSQEWHFSFAEYEKAASRALTRPKHASMTWEKRRRA